MQESEQDGVIQFVTTCAEGKLLSTIPVKQTLSVLEDPIAEHEVASTVTCQVFWRTHYWKLMLMAVVCQVFWSIQYGNLFLLALVRDNLLAVLCLRHGNAQRELVMVQEVLL